MAKRWYYMKGGKRVGPVTSEQLRQLAVDGQLLPTDKVTCDGMSGWAEASRVKGLMPSNVPPPLPQSNAASILLNPSPSVAGAPLRPRASVSSGKGWGTKIALTVAAVFVVLTIIGMLAGDKKNKTANPTASTTGDKGTRQSAEAEPVTASPQGPAQQRRPVAEGATAAAPSVKLPDFSKVDYSHDFAKDDYRTIPAGARKDTRTGILKGDTEEDKYFKGSYAEEEGYTTASGEFVRHGMMKAWYDKARSKQHLARRYLNGKKHGPVAVWYEDGKKRFEYVCVNGDQQGLRQEWADNGQLVWEGHFLHDKRYGVCKEWDATTGKLVDVETWRDGVSDGPHISWYANGNKKLEQVYVNGRLHGACTRWYDTGQKAEESYLENGLFQGQYWYWFPDGSVKDNLRYDHGTVLYKKGDPVATFLEKLEQICERNNPQGSYMWFGNYTKGGLHREFGAPDKEGGGGETEIWTYNCGDGVVGLEFENMGGGRLVLKETLYKKPPNRKTMKMTTQEFRAALAKLTRGGPPSVKVSDLLDTFNGPTVEVIPYVPFRKRQIAYTCKDGVITLTVTVDGVSQHGDNRSEPASYRIADIGVQ